MHKQNEGVNSTIPPHLRLYCVAGPNVFFVVWSYYDFGGYVRHVSVH